MRGIHIPSSYAVAFTAALGMLATPVVADAAGQARVVFETAGGQTRQADLAWRNTQSVELTYQGGSPRFLLDHGKLYRTDSGTPVEHKGAVKDALLPKIGPGSTRMDYYGTPGKASVAGVDGQRWAGSLHFWKGNKHNAEVVLSDRPDVVEMFSAWSHIGHAMVGLDRMNDVTASGKLTHQHHGALRLGKLFEVRSISDRAPPASLFALATQEATMPSYPRGSAKAFVRRYFHGIVNARSLHATQRYRLKDSDAWKRTHKDEQGDQSFRQHALGFMQRCANQRIGKIETKVSADQERELLAKMKNADGDRGCWVDLHLVKADGAWKVAKEDWRP